MKESIENQVLGKKETKENLNNVKTFFVAEKKFKVKNVGSDSFSIVDGSIIKNILPFAKQQEIANGLKNLTYNGFIIEVIEEIPTVKETVEETETVAPKPKKKKRVADD
jgi:thermostable 8-oxoguanine DNA glycosylase